MQIGKLNANLYPTEWGPFRVAMACTFWSPPIVQCELSNDRGGIPCRTAVSGRVGAMRGGVSRLVTVVSPDHVVYFNRGAGVGTGAAQWAWPLTYETFPRFFSLIS